jgi:hypothetical protein
MPCDPKYVPIGIRHPAKAPVKPISRVCLREGLGGVSGKPRSAEKSSDSPATDFTAIIQLDGLRDDDQPSPM